MAKDAIILLSGGLDSATCLAMTKAQGYNCYAITFDYDQRHNIELDFSKRLADHFQVVEHRVVKIDNGTLQDSALTDRSIDVPDYVKSSKIPVTYVPARNTLFLSYALGWAELLNINTIVIACHILDYSHYPDCRPEYIAAFEKMANLATKRGVEGDHVCIETPIISMSKAEIIQTGKKFGVDFRMTISCYRPDQQGRSCGTCDSCTFRNIGFQQANIPDPTPYFNKELAYA